MNFWDINDSGEIASVGDLVEKLKNASSEKGANVKYERQVFFRGESKYNEATRLMPKVFRAKYKNKEKELYYDAITNFPEDFINLPRLSKLAKMQHYGYPTRLLDITSNPLVALYFACSSKENLKKDGYFYLFKTNTILNYDSDKALLISCLSHLNANQQKSLYNFLLECKNDKELKKYNYRITNEYMANRPKKYDDKDGAYQFNKIIGEALRERPSFVKHNTVPIDLISRYVVRPLIQNERQKKQEGLFIILGLFDKDADARIKKDNGYIEVSSYKITSGVKGDILKELEMLGVHKASILCDIVSRAIFNETK